MPIHSGKDKQGSFYQWGKTGKKYYYVSSNEESRKRAYKKAEQQQTAIYSSGWKGDSFMRLIRVKKKVDKFDPALAEQKSEWFDFKKEEINDKIRSKFLRPLFFQLTGDKFEAKVDIVNGPTLDFEDARDLANDILKAYDILSKASIETKKKFPDMKR